jgi:lipopolysaccharide export LptBFGC system permease protein LptF
MIVMFFLGLSATLLVVISHGVAYVTGRDKVPASLFLSAGLVFVAFICVMYAGEKAGRALPPEPVQKESK